MKMGLSVFGTTYAMGLHPQSDRPAIRPKELMDQAQEAGLSGVEFPLNLLELENVEEVAQYAETKGQFITVAAGGYTPDKLADAIEAAVQLGAKTVRTVVGGANFGGDRRRLTGQWQAFLQEVLDGLRASVSLAERAGVCLAVENHQDLASEELLWLCETIDSPHFGINLDAGNPLATAEEPIDFAKRVAPYLKNVHLKDYWIYLSKEGYRLVRCPLGQGVIDFPALFDLLHEKCPEMTFSIELGALEARNTRVLAEDYWTDYPPRSAAQLAQVLQLVRCHAKPPADWRTPYEKGEPVKAIIAYEEGQLATSLAYIVPLFRKYESKINRA